MAEQVTEEITAEAAVAKVVKALQIVLQDQKSLMVAAVEVLHGALLKVKAVKAEAVKVDKTLVAEANQELMDLAAEAAEVVMPLVVKAEMEE